MKHAVVVLAVTSCIVSLCRAATPPPVPEGLLACRKLQDDGERVRCYDAQIAKLTGEAVARSRFGEETLPPAAQPKSRPPEETALLSSITALRKASSGTYTVSLANGQIWRQEESSQAAQFFRVGDDVRIEKAALGSYHMSTSSTGAKNWVRVTRIQ